MYGVGLGKVVVVCGDRFLSVYLKHGWPWTVTVHV